MELTNGCRSPTIFLIIGAAALLALGPVTAKVDWRRCEKSLPDKCGEAIGKRVVLGKDSAVSVDCCVALVKMGKPCHDAFTQGYLKGNDRNGRPYLVISRSNGVWKECVEVVKFVFPPAKTPNSS